MYFPASTLMNGGGRSFTKASNPTFLSKIDADLYWLCLQGVLIKKVQKSSKDGLQLLWWGYYEKGWLSGTWVSQKPPMVRTGCMKYF